MSFYEECLTLGNWLSPDEKEALYRYLLESKEETYRNQVNELLRAGYLTSRVANGEILYEINDRKIFYSARKIGTSDFTEKIRTMNFDRANFQKVKKLVRFFAQAEVDVIQNFPNPGENSQANSGFTCFAYPYYDLNYYSNGRGKLLGLFKKIKKSNSENLTKLRTL